TLIATLDHHVDIGIVGALGRSASANFDEDGVARRAGDHAGAIRNAGLPGCRVTGLEYGFAVVLAQHYFAFEHINKLVFLFVPVALRGRRARLERTDVHAQMIADRGVAETLA